MNDSIYEVKRYSLINASGKIEELKNENLQVGQVLWLNGYGQSKQYHERRAIYEIENNRWGTQYKCVNLDTFEKCIEDHPRHESKIFGIGIYYTTGDIASPEEITEALSKANRKEIARKNASEIEAKRRAELIEKGKIIFEENRPEGADFVIIAESKVDESDIQTDYFNSRTVLTIILAFSKTKRDMFDEMRKAAEHCYDIPSVNELKDAPKEFEHREKYSMGAGYYLGKSHYSGLIIRKVNCSPKWNLDDLYYETGRGSFYAYKKIRS